MTGPSTIPPVLFLVFNRPATTARVFAAIRAARPPRLYVAADGPRTDRPGEAAACAEVRRIASAVDWPCELKTLLRDTNLGCRQAVSAAIGWFFDQEPEGIILEDDCLPHPDFFLFCADLLPRYRHQDHILMVSGDNFQPRQPSASHSYYFSGIPHIWGWASWRRAWRLHDPNLLDWPGLRFSGWLESVLCDPTGAAGWTRRFDDAFRRRIDTWDYAWTFTCWRRKSLCILPSVNLVSNIGFGTAATHTARANPYANLPSTALAFPLHHPTGVPQRDLHADAFTEQTMFKASWRCRLLYASRRLVKKMISQGPSRMVPPANLTFEQAVTELRTRPGHRQLLHDSFLDENPREAALRFAESAEFAATLHLLGGAAKGVVVDVGAGNGIASCAFAKAGARQVVALEPDRGPQFGLEAIRLAAGDLPVRCLEGCAEAIPLPDGFADVVYVRQALHHLETMETAFREFARILRPGGWFLAVREPVVDSPAQLRRFLAAHPIHALTGKENAYGLERYLKAAENAGLHVECVLGPWDSIVNAFPAAKTPRELEQYAETYLRLRLGSAMGGVAAALPGVQFLVWRWLKRRVAGRLVGVLAGKPPSPASASQE
ncbi:MAG: class I SAM-dependent methyltransferase [Lentisphaeria bacterium]